jgi:CRISPR system Cascade subunit CasA
MTEFNLIDAAWIPCLDLDGKHVELGIKDTLLRAHELREVVDDSPLVTVAIHRMLLAILYRAFEGPTEMEGWQAIWNSGSFQSQRQVIDYLQRWCDRFYLFHDTHPFMQVAGLDLNKYKANGDVKQDRSSPMMRLAKEAPDAQGRILFDHRMSTERPDYEPKQIVKMILSTQSYAGTGVAASGKVGATPIEPTPCAFAPCVDGIVVWLQGDHLFQTLMLNLVPHEVGDRDLPAWEDDDIVQSAIRSWTRRASFAGNCQRYAPLSRFVRVISRNSIFFTNGLRVEADANDPMKAYRRENDDKHYVVVKLLEHRAAWRDFHTLMAIGRENSKPPQCLNHAARLFTENALRLKANVAGMATNKDKTLLWRHERMPVPAALLNEYSLIERLGGLLQSAEQAASELLGRTKRMASLFLSPTAEDPNGRKPDSTDVKMMLERLDSRPAYWARLERHFFDLLEHLPDDWDEQAGGWRPDDEQRATNTWRWSVRLEAQRALEESVRQLGTSARAMQAVARVRTDFTDDDLRPLAQRQARRKDKGGTKR